MQTFTMLYFPFKKSEGRKAVLEMEIELEVDMTVYYAESETKIAGEVVTLT